MKTREPTGWLIGCILLSGFLFIGCLSGPPRAWEQKMFDIRTSNVPTVQMFTNWYPSNTVVLVTNPPIIVKEPYAVLVTNPFTAEVKPEIRTVLVTNREAEILLSNVIQKLAVIEARTNWVEEYDYQRKPKVEQQLRDVGGAVGGLAGPFGGLAAGLIGGLYGLYAKRRSTKQGGVLTQGIETAREIIKNTPQGQALDEKFRSWMIEHQAQAGVIKDVGKLVSDNVDNQEARGVAKEIGEAAAKATA